ncbi:Six-hairpin glycosidase [Syntrophomonas zehnderi OL-4]|uniref:Six-hairpin glycosidase n=1 Tax=Syntrophomonas zehnderi OL-4 TaxID=690567 RepID=A0A0E4G9Y7_9FIRM|nr:hypothetical protein [Syntrophomonas zehnderi]CFX29805.1 Six-hairpin glycosidase [Syntrophomonas zehnderi OL-4]
MLNYKHLINMTDTTGLLQFSKLDQPDPQSGYTLDDNARALLVALFMGEDGYPYARLYSQLLSKLQGPNGSWCNLYLNDRFIHRYDSEDSIGRAFLACSAATMCEWPDIAANCTVMLQNALLRIIDFTSPRGIAYSLIGLCKGRFPFLSETALCELVNLLAARLINLFNSNQSRDWKWFEDSMTYCNGVIPQALFAAYAFNGDKKCLKVAHESLGFLNDSLFSRGYLSIVGNEGWYTRGCKLPLWDQQPVDAASVVFACWEAYQAIGLKEYQNLAFLAHEWYWGKNINGLVLFNQETGGCYDALTREGVNLNQGAEAVLSWLLSTHLLQGRIIVRLPTEKSS